MTDEPNNPRNHPEPPGDNRSTPEPSEPRAPEPSQPQAPGPSRHRPHFSRRALRIAAAIAGSLCILVIIFIGFVAWYSTTAGFEHRVRKIAVTQLHKATGGRVQLGAFHVHIFQLGVEADNLTIHGKEASGQVPFFHVDQLVAHLKIIDLFTGRIGLSYLDLSHPVIHIIVYPNGSTNRPTPRAAKSAKSSKTVKSTNSKAISSALFKLAIDHAKLTDGLFILNSGKYHFNVNAKALQAGVSYDRLRKRYIAHFEGRHILLKHDHTHPLTASLSVQVAVAHNHIHLDHLTFRSGKSRLNLTGSIVHFAHPRFQASAIGTVNLRIINSLSSLHGVRSGVLHIQAQGGGTRASYALHGAARLDHFVYRPKSHQSIGLSASTQLLVTQDKVAATNLRAQFAGGGAASGSLEVLHWRHAAAPAPKPKRARRFFFLHKKSHPKAAPKPAKPTAGTVHFHVAGLPLTTLVGVIAPPRFSNLGFNTNFTGNLSAHWTGTLHNLSAFTRLKLAPGKAPAPHKIPVTGRLDASYSVPAGTARLQNVQLHTPGMEAKASGSIGVNPSLHGSKITLSLVARHLSEFNHILGALNMKSASRKLPVSLKGSAAFHGTVTGSLSRPKMQGRLTGSNLDVSFATKPVSSFAKPHLQLVSQSSNSSNSASAKVKRTIHINSVTASIGYSPQAFTLSQATIHAGKAVATASVTLSGDRISKHHYTFDKSSPIKAQATLHNASLQQLTPLLGVKVKATGTLDFQIHLNGTLGSPNGSGSVTLTGGQIYGESYRDLKADLVLSGHTFEAKNILYRQKGGKVGGSAQINLTSRHFQFDLNGSGFHLSRFHRLQMPKYPIGGVLNLQAKGSGTFQKPSVTATLHLAHLQFAQTVTGSADATAQLQDKHLSLDAAAHLHKSLLQLHATAQLTGEDPVKARLTASHFDLNPIATAFHMTTVKDRKPLNATITVHGPLRKPQALQGQISVQPLALALANVPVHTSSSIHAELKNGTLTLASFQLQGADLHVKAKGSVAIFGKKHNIQWHTKGRVNMKVAETFSSSINASGTIDFNLHANGTMHHPNLTGKATVNNVDIAYQQYVNGLSRMNGTLDFNAGRVQLKHLTAYSGGGLIHLTGFASYTAGLYAHIRATAHGVRVRYSGVTSTVNANIQIEGGVRSLLVSGHVKVTRFAVQSVLSVVSMVNSGSGISLPPNPNSLTSHIRLDIHVTSTPSLSFQNSIARIAGTVNLHVRGTAAQPSILGRVTITEGHAKLAGTTYHLQRGVIYFNNPIRIQPTIDLQATTQVENYDITVGIHGTPSHLHPLFRSSPPLSEQDIFSLLALGRTQQEERIQSARQSQAGVGSARTLLGTALNATVSSRIEKLFGGGTVKINPAYVTAAGHATARLTVQRQVSKDLTLTYATNVNSSAEQLIQGKLRLTHSFSILAQRDQTGVFNLIFTIRKRYK